MQHIARYTEWHHGYAAGDILRAVARAFEEAADSWSDLPDLPEFSVCTEFLRTTAAVIEYRARNLAPTAYDTAVEICSGLLQSGRALIGTPFGSNRLDYLLCGIAYRQADWIEPLKRRKSWLDPVAERKPSATGSSPWIPAPAPQRGTGLGCSPGQCAGTAAP